MTKYPDIDKTISRLGLYNIQIEMTPYLGSDDTISGTVEMTEYLGRMTQYPGTDEQKGSYLTIRQPLPRTGILVPFFDDNK